MITLAICTRDNAVPLGRTLTHILEAGIVQPGVVELLVIDNGSSPDTRTAVAAAGLGRPFKYLREERRGVAWARNRALDSFCGDALVFVDDDVEVQENWFESLTAPIISGSADVTMGFTAMPEWVRESKLPEALHYYFARFDQAAVGPDGPLWLATSNCCIARRALAPGLWFDVELGPGAAGFCEDTLFHRQLLTIGRRIVAVPQARVVHKFNVERTRPAALWDMARRMGKSEAYLDHHWGGVGAPSKLAPAAARMKWWKAVTEDWIQRGGSGGPELGDIYLPRWYALLKYSYLSELARLQSGTRNYRPPVLRKCAGTLFHVNGTQTMAPAGVPVGT